MKINASTHGRLNGTLSQMRDERQPWWQYWRDLARYITPRRYTHLESPRERNANAATATTGAGNSTNKTGNKAASFRNPDILDATGTIAARTLASGMLNGITSPARQWFKLDVRGVPEDGPEREWLDEVRKRMEKVLGESNFYNSMGVVFQDLSTFGSAAMVVYEDFDDIFRCYNFALGEYYFQQDNRQVVKRFAREFSWRADQMVREFGLDNVSEKVQRAFNNGGKARGTEFDIVHMLEPNDVFNDDVGVPPIFPYREVYWEESKSDGNVLRVRGFTDWPGVFPRWDVIGNDSYGTGPSADALADIRQLQHMTKRKMQGMDKLISPPVVADIQLQNRPAALMPNGITYVAGANNVGVKPIYTVNPPINEIQQDITRLQAMIREHFHNDLFRMISQIENGRTTATEIDARREEKLVLLGPVLERFETEALDPVISRVFSIMLRRGLLPPVPPSLAETSIDIQYISVLSEAQRSIGAAPIERFVGMVMNLGQAVPEVMEVPSWENMLRDYAEKIGVEAKNLNDPDQVAQQRSARQALQEIQAAGEAARPAAAAAKDASAAETDGSNILAQILGRN